MGAMFRAAALLPLVLFGLEVPLAAAERRCGWLENPTPANWSLVDRDAEWVLSVQGGAQAQGMDNLPDMSGPGWVVTNGSSYGYGCACLTILVDRRERRVTRLLSAHPLPLSRCQADRALPHP